MSVSHTTKPNLGIFAGPVLLGMMALSTLSMVGTQTFYHAFPEFAPRENRKSSRIGQPGSYQPVKKK
jgi:hypothetical protein